MMVVCPQCSYPYQADAQVIGSRGVQCDFCGWKGSSQELLQIVGGKVADDIEKDVKRIERLRSLFVKLSKGVSPIIGRVLIEEGFVKRSGDACDIARLAVLLRSASRTLFATVLGELYKGEEQDHGPN
jgi:hypothetical protein